MVPPLHVVGQGMLCFDSFHIHNVSLVPDLTVQLMSVGQITDNDCCVILDPNFAIFRIIAQVIWLVLAPSTVTHFWEFDWLCLPSTAPTSLASHAVAALFTSSFY
jgi:hypothetical protein